MRAVLTISANELRRVLRDRTAAFFVFVLPVVIIVIIGTTFGSTGSDLPVGVVDLDGSPRSRELVAGLDRSAALDVERYDDERDLATDVRTGRVEGGVVVDAGYGDALDGTGTAEVRLLADPAAGTGTPVRSAVRAAVGEQGRVVAAARFAAERAGAAPADLMATAEQAAARTPPIAVEEERVGDRGRAEISPFAVTAPSNLVLFVFVNSLTVGAVLAADRRSGIVHRLLATPNRVPTILLGIGAAKFAFALVQAAFVLAVGGWLFDVDWGDPVAAAALVVVFAVVSTAVGLLVGSVARSTDTAQSVAVPVAIGMGMLGGCMWPLEIVPDPMRIAGHAVPHAWAMDGWNDLVFDGEGLAAIAPELAVLAGYAVVLVAVAAWRLRVALTR